MSDEFWIVRQDCGIKTFPRAASTTILHTYGYGQSRKRWMEAPRKFIVIRNPWERLLSAYALFYGKRYADVSKLGTLNQLLEYMCKQPQELVDVHVRSQHTQLEGYVPKFEELVEMKWFLANPPMGIEHRHRNLWKNRTRKTPDYTFDPELYEEYKEIYYPDFYLWDRAKKTPKEGAKHR